MNNNIFYPSHKEYSQSEIRILYYYTVILTIMHLLLLLVWPHFLFHNEEEYSRNNKQLSSWLKIKINQWYTTNKTMTTKNYWPNVSTKSLFLCLITSRGENLLTRSTSAIGTLSEPRSTHHQLGLSSCVCAHWAPGSKFVPTFPSTAFQEMPPQQVLLCLVGFRKARFSTHVIYGDKAHINMFFWMKHEPSLRLILINLG